MPADASMRQYWYQILNEPDRHSTAAMWVNVFLAGVIILNLLDVVWSSVPEGGWELYAWIPTLHVVFTLIFAMEWGLRCWVSGEKAEGNITAARARWHYVTSPLGLIDLLSFLPVLVWIMLLGGTAGEDFRILKLVAIVRMFKLTRYSASLTMLARVYRENYRILLAAVLVMLMVSFIAATGIYLFERYAQPEHFGSIPSSMWWAFVTLTTVGYGDVVPMTMAGKVFGGIVMLCGIGLAATPAGIFASTFVQLIREQELERRRRSRMARKQKRSGESAISLKMDLTQSEQNEVNLLMADHGLTLDQAISVVLHFRR